MACKIRIKVKKKKYIRGDNTTMKYTSIIIPFVGGLGMFIYGMQTSSILFRCSTPTSEKSTCFSSSDSANSEMFSQ